MAPKFGQGLTNDRTHGVSMANNLANWLESGEAMKTMTAPFRLNPGELCHTVGPASLQMFIPGGDGSYVHKTRFGLSPVGIMIGAATMAGNQARKKRARDDAAEAWRPVGQGNVYFTNQRLCIQMTQEWNNIWYQDIMTAGNDGQAIQIQRNGEPAVRIAMPDIDFFFTALYWLAFNQIVRPQVV